MLRDRIPVAALIAVELEAREIDWEFVPGTRTRAWGYDGQIPGPVLEGHVGDVLEVRFTNRLPQATNIHWHGLRVPAAMDGTEMVQPSVAPGETFVYRFRLPDAGTFWYHPHTNETVQLEMGLSGALIVRGPDEPRVDAERVLVLDDVRLDKHGRSRLSEASSSITTAARAILGSSTARPSACWRSPRGRWNGGVSSIRRVRATSDCRSVASRSRFSGLMVACSKRRSR